MNPPVALPPPSIHWGERYKVLKSGHSILFVKIILCRVSQPFLIFPYHSVQISNCLLSGACRGREYILFYFRVPSNLGIIATPESMIIFVVVMLKFHRDTPQCFQVIEFLLKNLLTPSCPSTK